MANSLCFTPVSSLKTLNKPGIVIDNSVARKIIRVNQVFHNSRTAKIRSLEVKGLSFLYEVPEEQCNVAMDSKEGIVKVGGDEMQAVATDSNQSTKQNSIVCADCDGNGSKQCSQCKGMGVNSVDHFNGQFKAGGLCWLCRGKREILCGNCNGAGFVGGFMSTFDE
ncbi:hypothetical protein JRO89_XS04G0250600 [Xanthoceras sorbifolium]|uniref:BSD2 cysteine rich domain-containing protein n=1 Tax=Xanthoceras sorbifolium TaxID=99658 RepID=A0ABQ8I6Y9_9ROSI|nr:hypothetical protein JRO89_XS04G0250600 [Xanthoceras sorbifolium]